jgi:hypothetical protein
MMDFEAFGQSVDADMSKTPWPPTGPSAISQTNGIVRQVSPSRPIAMQGAASSSHAIFGGESVNYDAGFGQTMSGIDMGMLESDFGWGQGMGAGMGVDDGASGAGDGFGWLSGIGAAGGFGIDGDLGFAQDSFWWVLSQFS